MDQVKVHNSTVIITEIVIASVTATVISSNSNRTARPSEVAVDLSRSFSSSWKRTDRAAGLLGFWDHPKAVMARTMGRCASKMVGTRSGQRKSTAILLLGNGKQPQHMMFFC